MGRTAVNISGGLQATSIVAKEYDMINDDKLNLKIYPFKTFYILNKKIAKKRKTKKEKQKIIDNLKIEYKEKINEIKKKKKKNKNIEIKKLKLELKKKIKTLKIKS